MGDRPPGLPKRPSRLAGPYGSAESPTRTSLATDEAGLRVRLSSITHIDPHTADPWHWTQATFAVRSLCVAHMAD